MALLELRGEVLAVSSAAVAVLCKQLRDELEEARLLAEDCRSLLGREVASVAQYRAQLLSLSEALGAATAAGIAAIPWNEHTRRCLCAVLRWAQEDFRVLGARNELRRRLGGAPSDLLVEESGLREFVTSLESLVAVPSPRLMLREWLSGESSHLLDLVRRNILFFIEKGTWLDLNQEAKRWSLHSEADIYDEVKTLWSFGYVDDSRHFFVANLSAFALCPEADEYVQALLDIGAIGAGRFLDARLGRIGEAYIAPEEVASLMSERRLEHGRSFLEAMSSWLPGYSACSTLPWQLDRSILRWFPAADVKTVIKRRREHEYKRNVLPEQCLWLLTVLADFWINTGSWPNADDLLVDSRLGSAYVHALEAMTGNWLCFRFPDRRTVELDLDGLLLAATDRQGIAEPVARVVGALASALNPNDFASMSQIVELAGVDERVVRQLLPLLSRPDLGLAVLNTATSQMTVQISRAAMKFQGVRSAAELAARWRANWRLHPCASWPGAEDFLATSLFAHLSLAQRVDVLIARLPFDVKRKLIKPAHAESVGTSLRTPSSGENDPLGAPLRSITETAQASVPSKADASRMHPAVADSREIFSNWLRDRCAEGEGLLIADLAPSPRKCFFEPNSSQYAGEFYTRFDKWRRWRSALITGLNRRVRSAKHLAEDAAERFSDAKLLSFRLRDFLNPQIVRDVDLSARHRFVSGPGWIELRGWFQAGIEEPDWNTARQVTLNELRSFAAMVFDQLDELDLVGGSIAGLPSDAVVDRDNPPVEAISAPAERDRYTCQDRLGGGRFGEVWRARDGELKRDVAIKFIRSTGATRRDVVEHARALARVPHPNIVAIFDVVPVADPGSGALVDAVVMELVEGKTLTETLGHRLESSEARRIANALLDGIAAYHARQLAHLDLHDDNVIVGPIVKILDPLYFDTALLGSTATRDSQQARDLRAVRDLLIQIVYYGVPRREVDTSRNWKSPVVRVVDMAT